MAHRPVNGFESLVGADPKKFEKVLEIAALDERELELEQSILAVIDVYGVNFSRTIEQVVEGIAPGARNHDHAAVGFELEQLTVDARIFPTGVVDQLPAVNMVEYEIVRCL